MAKAPKEPTDAGDKAGTSYHFGTTNAGPGAVFGTDQSKNKTIAGRDAATTTGGDTEAATGVLGLGIGLLLIAMGIVLAIAVPAANLLVRFVFVFIVAMGAAMLANGLLGKMRYNKGPIRAYGPYAVFALVAAAGATVVYLDRPNQELSPPAVPVVTPDR
ncbi:MAG TPA: hypothetical protein VGR35_09590 [Tepidisphaeraceae bacterium]|nr:hypothetical protein [Tepidisphaeraceae bacterium]